VLHLAAQPGVRYRSKNPACLWRSTWWASRTCSSAAAHPAAAPRLRSSSSVYGANSKLHGRKSQNVDNPVSVYAAARSPNELMAHVLLMASDVPRLRYFTVYGPWGRRTVAMLFARAIMDGKPIAVFKPRRYMQRDFTYVDDIVEARCGFSTGRRRTRVYNIGNHQPVALLATSRRWKSCWAASEARDEADAARRRETTYADTSALRQADRLRACHALEPLARFAEWFKSYYAAK